MHRHGPGAGQLDGAGSPVGPGLEIFVFVVLVVVLRFLLDLDVERGEKKTKRKDRPNGEVTRGCINAK